MNQGSSPRQRAVQVLQGGVAGEVELVLAAVHLCDGLLLFGTAKHDPAAACSAGTASGLSGLHKDKEHCFSGAVTRDAEGAQQATKLHTRLEERSIIEEAMFDAVFSAVWRLLHSARQRFGLDAEDLLP